MGFSNIRRLNRFRLHFVGNVFASTDITRNGKFNWNFNRQFALETVKVPRLGDSVTEGTLSTWKKNVGDFVQQDETIAVIDTDKVSVDINSKFQGVCTQILANEGDTVNIDQPICEIDTDQGNPQSGDTKKEEKENTPLPESSSSLSTPSSSSSSSSSTEGTSEKEHTEQKELNMATQNETVQLQKKDHSLKEQTKGNITEQTKNVKETEIVMNTTGVFERIEKRVKLLPIRKRIAERLKEAQNTCALLTTFNECDMSKAIILKNELKEIFQKKYNCKIGFVSLFLYASTLALKQMPNVNAYIENDTIVYKNYVDISVAVATPSGLTVPVIRNCQNKKIAELELALSDLATKARNNKLTVADFTGGTFTISNGGVFGSLMSTPIVNMPQSAILGMHTIKNRAVVINGEITIRPIMYLALTYDHRLLDGRDAVQFLCLIRDYIENPTLMLIE